MDLQWNNSILYVDEDESMQKRCVNALSRVPVAKKSVQTYLFFLKFFDRERTSYLEKKKSEGDHGYNVLVSSSGEDAVHIVAEQSAAGRQMAIVFIDINLKGKYDAEKTIKQMHKLDPRIFFVVLKDSVNKIPSGIRNLFLQNLNGMYLNKPFLPEELVQSVEQLLYFWNQQFINDFLVVHSEMSERGLRYIYGTLKEMMQSSQLAVQDLLGVIIAHFLSLFDAENGIIVIIPLAKIRPLCRGVGKFYQCNDLLSINSLPQWNMITQSMNNRAVLVEEKYLAAPLIIAEESFGVLFVQDARISKSQEAHLKRCLETVYASQFEMLLDHLLVNRNTELVKRNQELMNILGKLSHSEKLREKYENLSNFDSLTGIPNRRYVQNRFEEERESLQSQANASIACLMIDVDYFKKINDVFGHLAGDYVLVEMGKILESKKRDVDILGRYGGEEFVMIFTNMDQDMILTIAERIRASVEENVFSFNGQEIQVTVSLGIAFFSEIHDITFAQIVEKSDKALYQAKKGGRNKVVWGG